MRIAILTSSYPRFPGDGTAPFVKSIAEEMSKLGHEVEVIAPYDPEVVTYETKGVKIHRFKYTLLKKWHIMGHGRALEADVRLRPLAFLLLPFYLLAAIITLWQVTGRQKTEIIYVHWVLPNGPIAAFVSKIRRIRFIMSLHGSDLYVAQRNRLFGFVAHWVFSQASAVTACSPELKEHAMELGAPEATELIAWGANPNIFKPTEDRKALREELGWGNGIFITTMGRMVYKKGFDILLRALPSILEKYTNITVIIGGEGPLLSKLKELAGSLGISKSVQFIGRVPWNEVPKFLAASDIFVLPSVVDASGNLDGLPTVLIEAMGCGSTIIASDIGGVPLAIRNHENGLLVTPGSVPELNQALMVLLNNTSLSERLGRAARQTVVEDLNWAKVVRRIEKLLYVSISKKSNILRMGTIYRDAMLSSLDLVDATKGRVLDIGCYDGFLLGKLEADFRVGVDLKPMGGILDISFVKADARWLPFKKGSFNKVYALDVIEHIEDDISFSQSLSEQIASGGRLVLTTPSANIRLNPPFLTTWISKKWGHIYRLGYSSNRLLELFGSMFEIKVQSWNAPAYRALYPLLRSLQFFFPHMVADWVRSIASRDSERKEGDHGFLIMTATRKTIETI